MRRILSIIGIVVICIALGAFVAEAKREGITLVGNEVEGDLFAHAEA